MSYAKVSVLFQSKRRECEATYLALQPRDELSLLEVWMSFELAHCWLDLRAAHHKVLSVSFARLFSHTCETTYILRISSVLSLVKLLTPIALSLPFFTIASIAFHVSVIDTSVT